MNGEGRLKEKRVKGKRERGGGIGRRLTSCGPTCCCLSRCGLAVVPGRLAPLPRRRAASGSSALSRAARARQRQPASHPIHAWPSTRASATPQRLPSPPLRRPPCPGTAVAHGDERRSGGRVVAEGKQRGRLEAALGCWRHSALEGPGAPEVAVTMAWSSSTAPGTKGPRGGRRSLEPLRALRPTAPAGRSDQQRLRQGNERAGVSVVPCPPVCDAARCVARTEITSGSSIRPERNHERASLRPRRRGGTTSRQAGSAVL